jgi:hypothetical protein
LARQSDISLTSLARTLFKRVQNIDGIIVLRDAENPVFGSSMDTDLVNSGSNPHGENIQPSRKRL